MPVDAERAYLFRHAIMRDVAYELQPPQERATLHRLVIGCAEALCGGRPELPSFTSDEPMRPHPTDVMAAELAEHTRLARMHETAVPTLEAAERLYLRRAARAAVEQFRMDEAGRSWLRLADVSEGADRVACFRQLVDVEDSRARYESARHFAEQGLHCAQEMQDQAWEGIMRCCMGSVLLDLGRVDKAEREFVAGLALAKIHAGQLDYARALSQYATLLRQKGRLTDAENALQEALAIFSEQGNRIYEAMALGQLANVYLDNNPDSRAEQALTEALNISRELQLLSRQANITNSLGILYHYTGRVEESKNAYDEAIRLAAGAGLPRMHAIALGNIASVYHETGELDRSEKAVRHALENFREMGDVASEALFLGNLASLLSVTGRANEARDALLEGLRLSRSCAQRRTEGVLTSNLAALCADSELGWTPEQIEQAFNEAIDIHRETDNRRHEGMALCNKSAFLVSQTRLDEARRCWESGKSLLVETSDETSLQRKTRLLHEACQKAGIEPFE